MEGQAKSSGNEGKESRRFSPFESPNAFNIGVDDVDDPADGQARLQDVGRDDDFTKWGPIGRVRGVCGDVAGSKIRCCCNERSEEYSGMQMSGHALSGSWFSRSPASSLIFQRASSISSSLANKQQVVAGVFRPMDHQTVRIAVSL